MKNDLRHCSIAVLTAIGMFLSSSAVTASDDWNDSQDSHNSHKWGDRATGLVKEVRDATRRFHDVSVAISEEYGAFLGCVSGPEEGAMGIHFVNGALVQDGLLDAARPEILVYEPGKNGRL
ncbi:MAG TPA: hypothetical protein VNQ14_14220, partial [Woeseiaceae bacterium]|nr:hypothetical protein [Woeseiaceae bacterium]